VQLKEAAALGEHLDDLDGETRELEAKLTALDEKEIGIDYQRSRKNEGDRKTRDLRYGYLRGQVAGWAAEFERVTQITGVRFGEGKSDAVDKVVHLYSANELRNKSLFKFVTEDVVLQTETLEAELAEESAQATRLEAEQAAADTEDAKMAQQRLEASEAQHRLDANLEKATKAVDEILPLVDKLGLQVMDKVGVKLPQHMEGVPVAPPTVEPFLNLLEEATHTIMNQADQIVRARAPPPPANEEEAKERALQPPEVVSHTLGLLRAATAQRVLASAKDASKLLHNDSSERLLTQMG